MDDGILLPGLVNTHTHLELTGFAETAAGIDFPSWIRGIRSVKQTRTAADFHEAARRGLRECWQGGVTTIADTGDSGAVLGALAEMGGSGVAYHEVFGPHPSQLEESFAGLVTRVNELRPSAHGRVRIGVSPHAPYTVSGPLFARVAAWARQEALPLAVHVAESIAETEFVARSSGPFAEAWQARGIPRLDDPSHLPILPSRAATRASPVAWLRSLGVLGPDCLCIHAIQLAGEDIRLLREAGAAVAHCPISNAKHGHGKAPVALLRRAGVRVGVGTDSVASVGVLDLFAEMRAAQALSGTTDAETLALGTIEGARALGMEQETGSLKPGKWADVIAVRTDSGPNLTPLRRALDTTPSGVVLTLIGGRVVYQSPRPGSPG